MRIRNSAFAGKFYTPRLVDAAPPNPSLPRRRRAAALENDLRCGVIDGALYSTMVGIGESYLALFVLAAGLGEVAAGLVSTIPFLLGAVLQLAAPWGVRRLGSLHRWVVFAATLQALSLVPLAVMALTGRASLTAVFLVATIYWAASMGCGAGWSTWIGMIIPARIRARYFSFKSRIGNVAAFAGLASGGLILERWSGAGALWPFAVLFLVAAACRAGCAYYLWRQSDTGPVPDDHRHVGPAELVSRLKRGRDGRFMLYMMLVQIAVQIGQPFFAPFMRAQLEMNYTQILALTGAAFITKSLMQPVWGAFAHRHGANNLLLIGGVGIIPLAALWLVSPNFGYLLVMQLFAGAMWSAYELATLLLMFEEIREEERTSLWATFNLMNAAAMVVGSLLGGAILRAEGGYEGYTAIFLLSLAARLATVIYLRRDRAAANPQRSVAVELEAVRPGAGSIDRPMIADLGDPASRAVDAGIHPPDRP